MAFYQPPPELENQFTADRVLRSYLARVLPPEVRAAVEPELQEMGALAAGELFALQRADRLRDPVLTQWDPWGHRVDRIEVTPLWKRCAEVAAQKGLIALPYERPYGALSRVAQFALVYLFNPSSDVYTCPLAMTDGAARTLLSHENLALRERALPRLTSRDPARAWTSGQWMTERTGGSDVGLSETVARKDGEQWTLWGTKWFTSATTSEMALTLGRPEGNPGGGRGLALFYVETRGPDGVALAEGIRVNRLKDKLGTRKVPTAELTLEGLRAQLVAGTSEGVRNIAPMLNITRTWNAVCASSAARRGVALARDYAQRRVAFGAPLSRKPLHAETLAGLQAEAEAMFHLTFHAVELLGRAEGGEASEEEQERLRLLTPLVKLTTGRQVMHVLPEVLEAFGGAGYVEDTGLPVMQRDAQVLPIWEGTTNVLSLDALKTLARGGAAASFASEVASLAATAKDAELQRAGALARDTVGRALAWVASAATERGLGVEQQARALALTLGRSLALALLVRHAQWSLEHERDGRARAAALRFARHGVDLLGPAEGSSLEESTALANDAPLPV